MIKFTIIAIGNIKEKYFVDAINEYTKRISAFAEIEIIELKEKLLTDTSDNAIQKNLEKESEDILHYISTKDYVIVLDRLGKCLDSIKLSTKLRQLATDGYSNVKFVIGSSYGLSSKIKNRANFMLSFSELTFPHQLFRVMLVEQIYRALTILNNKTYHK